MKPLAVDLCCGLGGWTEGLLAEGYDVVGFDVERHVYGSERYPAQLVLQDILTIDGRQFRGKISLIVASPPCQEYSYMAMPWSRGKAIAADYRAGRRDVKKLTALFDACVRIGREAECPTVIENVRGAQPWIGRARAKYGSFFFWGDVPALMPNGRVVKGVGIGSASWQEKEQRHPNDPRNTWSKSSARKAASARIAKIPLRLARFIAYYYHPHYGGLDAGYNGIARSDVREMEGTQ